MFFKFLLLGPKASVCVLLFLFLTFKNPYNVVLAAITQQGELATIIHTPLSSWAHTSPILPLQVITEHQPELPVLGSNLSHTRLCVCWTDAAIM